MHTSMKVVMLDIVTDIKTPKLILWSLIIFT